MDKVKEIENMVEDITELSLDENRRLYFALKDATQKLKKQLESAEDKKNKQYIGRCYKERFNSKTVYYKIIRNQTCYSNPFGVLSSFSFGLPNDDIPVKEYVHFFDANSDALPRYVEMQVNRIEASKIRRRIQGYFLQEISVEEFAEQLQRLYTMIKYSLNLDDF